MLHSQATSNAPALADLVAEVEALRADNARLRAQLGMPPMEVKVMVAQPAAAAPQGAQQGQPAPAMATEAEASALNKLVGQASRDGIKWPQPNEPNFWDRPPREQAAAGSSSAPAAAESSAPPAAAVPQEKDSVQMHVCHITAEMAPLAKVGGLGDVVTGLARSCALRGHVVTVFLPFYSCLDTGAMQQLRHLRDFEVPKGRVWDGVYSEGSLLTSAWSATISGIPVLLLRPADGTPGNLFRGGRIYGGSYNEAEAYLYFCRAALEFMAVAGWQPHIIQVHDWHAAPAAMLFWEAYSSRLWRPRIVLTIHNMDHSGECRQDEFAATGLPGERFASVEKALDERTIGHNPERLNLVSNP